VVHDTLDEVLPLEVADGHTSQRAVDFETLDEDRLANEAPGGSLLENTIEGRLVKNNGVLSLVLDLSLRPLLFLGGLAATGGGSCFSFSLMRERQVSAPSRKYEWNPGERTAR